MIKKYKKQLIIVFFILFVFSLIGNIVFIDKNTIYKDGKNYKTISNAEVFWYPNHNIETVSYYMIPKGELLKCDYAENSFLFCEWEFSKKYEKMYGWIEINKLKRVENE